jgi:hypothetical protein
MTPLRQQMIAALQLSGKGERTQQADVREVRLLVQFYGKSPHLLSEQELQHSFLHRQNVDGLAPASMRLCYRGIRFFYQHVLQRELCQRSGCLPQSQRASRDQQHWRGHPYPKAFVRHPSARSRGQSPSHPALPGARPTRNPHGLVTPHPNRS